MAIDGSHPLIYRHFAQGRIAVETMVLLDKIVGFSKLWAKNDDIVLNDAIKLMKKYSPFLEQFSPTEKKKLKDIVLRCYK